MRGHPSHSLSGLRPAPASHSTSPSPGARDGPVALTARRDPTREVGGEADQEIGRGLGVREGAVARTRAGARPLGQRAQEYGIGFGLALVLILMVFATWNDFVHLGIIARLVGWIT